MKVCLVLLFLAINILASNVSAATMSLFSTQQLRNGISSSINERPNFRFMQTYTSKSNKNNRIKIKKRLPNSNKLRSNLKIDCPSECSCPSELSIDCSYRSLFSVPKNIPKEVIKV